MSQTDDRRGNTYPRVPTAKTVAPCQTGHRGRASPSARGDLKVRAVTRRSLASLGMTDEVHSMTGEVLSMTDEVIGTTSRRDAAEPAG